MNIYNWLSINSVEFHDKVALKTNELEITYSELFGICNSLSNSLKKVGINKGDHVVICLPNSPEFVISYMAVISIGAVAIPVNSTYTSREMLFIIKHSNAKAIVLEQTNIETYLAIQSNCIFKLVLTTGNEGNFKQYISTKIDSQCEDVDSDDVAVIIYTAGLTGHPSGAMLTQRNLEHNSNLMKLCMNADHTDTSLTLIPCFHSFSASVNMLAMLRYGGTIYLMKKPDFKELRHIISNRIVSYIAAVPTLFYGLIYHPSVQDLNYSGMRTLISGGAALPIEIFNAFKAKYHFEIRQGYGLTEASPVCTVNNIYNSVKPTSIGICVSGVESMIVDEFGNKLENGQCGELIFRGNNIMKGYYGNREATNLAIRNNWLYTGDLGYQDDAGYLYVTSHKKDIIITSGFNVYPKEVENVIKSFAGVVDCIIIGCPNVVKGNTLKAFVVKGNSNLTEEGVISQAKKNLAPYKVPKEVTFIPEIPRDTDGKITNDLLQLMIKK